MNKINVGRAILGGLVTGLILNIGEFVLNTIVLGKDMASSSNDAVFRPSRAQPSS
jgi:hypothetical protein